MKQALILVAWSGLCAAEPAVVFTPEEGERPRTAVASPTISATARGRVSGRQVQSSGRTPIRPRIILRVINEAGVADRTLRQAREEAAAILGRSGIELVWLDCEDGRADWTSRSPCHEISGPADFWLRIAARKSAAATGELGYAELDALHQIGSAGVSYQAAEEVAQRCHTETFQILGAAIVHEIGHLMLGGAIAHSRTGVMSADWGVHELELISIGELRFTPAQANRLRQEIRGRSDHLAIR